MEKSLVIIKTRVLTFHKKTCRKYRELEHNCYVYKKKKNERRSLNGNVEKEENETH